MPEGSPDYRDPSIAREAEQFNASQAEQPASLYTPTPENDAQLERQRQEVIAERSDNPQMEYLYAKTALEEYAPGEESQIEQAYEALSSRPNGIERFKDWAARNRRDNHENEVTRLQADIAAKGDSDGSLRRGIEYRQNLLPLYDRFIDAQVARMEHNQKDLA